MIKYYINGGKKMNKYNPKGLTMTIVFEAESANYGESVGNVSALKKVSRGKGEQYTYISRQALRYNMIEQLGYDNTPVVPEGSGDKKVIQFSKDALIDQYPELDFFGYLKTKKGDSGKKRNAKVRLSNAISLETYKGDLDFLTNKGLADRVKENMNIAQSEIHKSLYKYTVVIDLDQIGVEEDDNIDIDNNLKAERVNKLLDVIAMLYRDIRARREDLKPLFVVGGVYDTKNPVFQNAISVKDGKLNVEEVKDAMTLLPREETLVGLRKGIFSNEDNIIEELKPISVGEFFTSIKLKVSEYYENL